MAVVFTADTHFGHGGALGLFRRPFPAVAAMDVALTLAWNDAVAPGDTVWHLGDLAVRAKPGRVAELLAGLNGEKHLIAGNNDGPATRDCGAWASVRDYAEIEEDGRRLVLCHYPLRSWNGMDRGAVNLHGHSHGKLAPLPRQFDVGVDVRDFRPVTLATLLAGGKRRQAATAASGSSANSSSGRRTPRSA